MSKRKNSKYNQRKNKVASVKKKRNLISRIYRYMLAHNVTDEDIFNSSSLIGDLFTHYPPNVINIKGPTVYYYHGLEEGLMRWDSIPKKKLIDAIRHDRIEKLKAESNPHVLTRN